jgi:hypothetical protein
MKNVLPTEAATRLIVRCEVEGPPYFARTTEDRVPPSSMHKLRRPRRTAFCPLGQVWALAQQNGILNPPS